MNKLELALTEISKVISKIAECNFQGWTLRERTLIEEAQKAAYKAKEILSSDQEWALDDTKEFAERRIKVVAIDDDPVLQKILKSKLEKKGVEVFSFLDPTTALKEIHGIRPEIILLDIMMPQMTGFEVIQKLKQEKSEHHCRIIVASGRQFTKDRLQSLELGADDFIEKPYDVNELYLRIKSLLK